MTEQLNGMAIFDVYEQMDDTDEYEKTDENYSSYPITEQRGRGWKCGV